MHTTINLVIKLRIFATLNILLTLIAECVGSFFFFFYSCNVCFVTCYQPRWKKLLCENCFKCVVFFFLSVLLIPRHNTLCSMKEKSQHKPQNTYGDETAQTQTTESRLCADVILQKLCKRSTARQRGNGYTARRAKFQRLLEVSKKQARESEWVSVLFCWFPVEVVRQTGSAIRDQMSARRRDAATLPSEMLPVQMIGTKVKGKRGQTKHARVHLKSKKNRAPCCHALRSRNKYALAFHKLSVWCVFTHNPKPFLQLR